MIYDITLAITEYDRKNAKLGQESYHKTLNRPGIEPATFISTRNRVFTVA